MFWIWTSLGALGIVTLTSLLSSLTTRADHDDSSARLDRQQARIEAIERDARALLGRVEALTARFELLHRDARARYQSIARQLAADQADGDFDLDGDDAILVV